MKFLSFNKSNLIFITLIPLVSLAPTKIDKTSTSFKITKAVTLPKIESKPIKVMAPKVELKVEHLVQALIQVESTGRDNITGDHHLGKNFAAGALQIRPVMLREVNRILKLQKKSKRFKLSDRFDRQKSIEMFHIWREYHHKDSSFEKIIRNWNGGPKGYLRKSTKNHWIKTQAILAQK